MSKILIIESDGDFSSGLRAELEAMGFEVTETQDGKRAVDTAKSERPDMVVLAVELSAGQSGYILCGKLKKDEETQSIPVIIIGNDEKGFEGHRKLKTRAEGYLKKPFETDQLLGIIGELIGLPESGGASAEVAIEEDEPLGGLEEAAAEEAGGEVRADPEFDMLDAAFEDASSPEAAEEPQAISAVEELPDEEIPVELPSEESAVPEESASLEGFSESSDADAALDGLSESTEEAGALESLDPAFEAPLEESLEEATPLEEESAPESLDPEPDAVTTMETALGADSEELASLRARVEELEADLAAARSSGGREKDVFALKDQISRKDKELLRLRQELNDKDKELVDLRERETELEQKLSGGAGDVARRDAQIKTLTQRVDSFGAEKKKLEVALQAAKEEAVDLRRKVTELEDRNSRNEERVVKAYQKIKGDEKLKDKTKKALAIAQQLLDEQAAAAMDSDVDEGPAVQDEEAQA